MSPHLPPERRTVEVVTTHLEMTRPDQLRPAPRTELVVREAVIASPELNRYLYTAVGGCWNWIDRLPWDYQRWLAYLEPDTMHTWVGYFQNTPVGYFELEEQPDRRAEIRSFGLLPQFLGRGYGGDLLTRAVEQAWALGPERVWLHTCTLDSPRGLANYLARGFREFFREQTAVELPLQTPGPWPGSGYAGP